MRFTINFISFLDLNFEKSKSFQLVHAKESLIRNSTNWTIQKLIQTNISRKSFETTLQYGILQSFEFDVHNQLL